LKPNALSSLTQPILTNSTVGGETKGEFYCGNGVLAADGYIYAVNGAGQVLKIYTTINNYYPWILDPMNCGGGGWGGPIVGADKCIYWPPSNVNRVLKFDPETRQLPWLVGGDLGAGGWKWKGGALASDGVIYCFPSGAKQILAIDPF
jgi:hypothetical protein